VDKVLEWTVKILTLVLSSVKRDPLAAILLGLCVASEFFALSSWRYWNPSFSFVDTFGPSFLLFAIYRLRRKGWVAAPLLFAVGIMLVALIVLFSFAVPWPRLLQSAVQAAGSLFLAVRCSP
jgi:predicted lysophospholipase L1 biosynthesis ABC-type transport system permease subunit